MPESKNKLPQSAEEVPIVNLGGTALNLPRTPIVGYPGGNGIAGKPLSPDELFLKGATETRSTGRGIIPISSFYTGGDRYDATRPFTDFEEMAAGNQSTANKWANGLTKMLGTAATTFISGTLGLAYGMGSAATNWKLSNLIDNDVTRAMDAANKRMEDLLPNYYSHAEQDAKWYSGKNILSANFWADKVFKNLGFSLGTIAGGFAWSKAFKMMGATNALVKAGYGMETATAIEQAMLNAPRAQKFTAFENALNSISQKYIKAPVAAGLKNSDRILTSVMGTFGEASLESLHNMNDFREKAIEEYKNTYLKDPTGEDLDRINELADSVGLGTFAANTILLTGTNYIQLPKILGSSKSLERIAINNIEKKGISEAFTQAVPKTKFGRVIGGVKGVGRFLFAPSESFEEGAQYAIQTGVNDYFDRAYKNRDDAKGFLSTVGEVMGNIFSHGVDRAFTDKEGLESMLIGGISGGMQQSYRTFKQGGLFGTGGKKGRDTQVAIAALNKTNINQVLTDQGNYIARAIGSQKLRQQAIAADDTLSEKDYEHDFTMSYLMPRIKYGKIDGVFEELSYYENQAMDKDGFDQLQTQKIANEKETREQFLSRINSLKETAKSINELYNVVNSKYSAVFLPDGNRKYSDEVIDKMVYASSKVRDYDKRIPLVSAELTSAGISGLDIISELAVGKTDLYNKALADITALGDTSRPDSKDTDTVNSYLEKLEDLGEMGLRRKKFLDEYNEMALNPQKYDFVEPAKTKVPEGQELTKVTTKTKDGDIELSVGQEYYAGAPMKKSKEGVRYPEFTKFKFLGKSENGKLILQAASLDPDVEGDIFEVDEDYFKRHQIDTVANIEDKPNAKFYIETAGLVFNYQLGKGKVIQGTLRYDRKKDVLYFQSVDGKRKLRVTREDFKPRKGFEKSKVYAVGQLTRKAQEALEETSENEAKAMYAEIESVISDLVDSTKTSLAEVNDKIEKKKEELAKVAEDVKALHITKKGVPRKAFVGVAKKTLNTLLATHKEIEKSIIQLEEEKAELEASLSYLQDAYDNKESLPPSYGQIIKSLKKDINSLEEMIDNTNEAIKKGTDLLDYIKGVLGDLLSQFNSFVSKLKAANPNLPMFLDELQERLERYLGEEGAKQFIENREGFTDIVEDLQDRIGIEKERLNLPNMEKQAEKISSQLAELQKGLDDLIAQQIAKSQLLESFEAAAEAYKLKKEQEEAVLQDEERFEKFLGTADDSEPTREYSEDYEQDPRKPDLAVVTGTKPVTPGYNGRDAAEHHQRANRFGAKLDSLPNRENIRGVVVTQKNQAEVLPGLVEFLKEQGDTEVDVDEKTTIALVMVEVDPETGEKFLIGEDGNRLETKDLNQAIFQVFPLELTWSGGGSMFRKSSDEDTVESLTEQYKSWRTKTLKDPSNQAHEIEASFGIPEPVTIRNAEGKLDPVPGATTSVEKAGLIKSSDLIENPMVTVPTLDAPLEQGSTRFEDPVGRPFLALKNAYVKLKNRNLTEKEAENIFNAIYRLAVNYFDNEDGIESEEAQRMLSYLRSIVYWGTPRDKDTGEPRPPGYNSVFFDYEGDGLFRQMKLFISGRGESINFTPSDLAANKTFIIGLLQQIYNNVNSKLTDAQWNESFTEVLSIDENGNIETRQWPNYQSYLLSDRLPSEDGLNGPVRPESELPLSVAMRPLEGENDVNRNGIYFTVKYEGEEFKVPKKKKQVKKEKKAKAEKKAQQKKKGKTKVAPEGKFILDGETVNKMVTKKGKKTVFFFADADQIISGDIDGGVRLILNAGEAQAVKDFFIQSGLSEKEATRQLKFNVVDAITGELNKHKKGKGKTKTTFALDTDIKIDEDEDIDEDEEDIKTGGLVFKKTNFGEEQGEQKDEEDLEEDEDEDDVMFGGMVEDDEEDIKDDYNDMEDDDPEYREVIERDILRFRPENWNQVEAWLKANFPNLPVYRVKNVIKSTNGRQAWGMFDKGALYIYENADAGTAYHEVFEAVWKMFSTPQERDSIRKEFRQRSGSFFDRHTMTEVKFSEATDKQVKEQLADEFIEYVQDGKIPQKPVDGRPFIVKLFSDLVNFIKTLVLGDQGKMNAEELFKRIGSGYYKKYSPHHSSLSFAKKGFIDINDAIPSDFAEYSIATFTGQEVHDIMQDMTYNVLLNIVESNKNLFEIAAMNKKDIYDEVRIEVRKNVTRLKKYTEKSISLKNITEEEGAEDIQRSMMMRAAIKNDLIWNELVAKHQEYLAKYNIEFDENDELQLTDENNTGRDDYQNATKIDTFKKSNPAIKLLLATLPIVEKDRTTPGKTVIVRSSTGGPILLPVSEVFVKLMNNLHTARNPDEMLLRIKEMAKKDVNYERLYRRITRRSVTTDGPIDLTNLNNTYDLNLLTAIWTTFKKQNPDVKNHYILENGEIQVGEASLSSATSQAKSDMINSMVKKISGKNKYFRKNEYKNVFESIPESVKSIPLSTVDDMVQFLKEIGISFRVNAVNNLPKDKKNKFREAVAGIRDSIKKAEAVATLSGKALGISGRLTELAEVKAFIENPEFDSTYFGGTGERKQTFIGTNAASDLFDALSQIKNLRELAGTQYDYILTDSFVKNSVILGKMFNLQTGNRIFASENLMKTSIADSTINRRDGKQKESSKLNFRERFIQEINLNMEGYYLNLVPGDAAIEWMMKMGNHVSASQLLESGYDRVNTIFKGYFISELLLSREGRSIVKGETARETTDMRFFKNILGEDLHDEIVKSEGSPEEVYRSFEKEITTAIKEFFEENARKTKSTLVEYDIVLREEGDWFTGNLDFGKETMTNDELNRHLQALSINYAINNIELHKLLYSDPYQYSDELKRIKNFNSPRQAIVSNSPKMNAAYNRVWNEGYDDFGRTDFTKDYFNSTTFADVLGVHDLPGYLKPYKETDGSGIIGLKAHRNFKIRAGQWTSDDEKQYKYEVVWEKNYYGNTLSEAEQAIYDAGNPHVRSTFTPIKPIVSGAKLNNKPYNDVMLDKFALYPISLRVMVEINKDSNAVKLYEKMQREEIDYVVFESGRKVGAEEVNEPYNEDGSFNDSPYKGIIKVPFSIMSVQAEVPSKDSDIVTRGTQATKELTMNLMDNGVPNDFMEDEKDVSKRYEAWIKLSDEEKMQSETYKEVKNNELLLNQLIETGYANLIKMLGMKQTADGIEVVDAKKAIKTLKTELFKREINDNLISAIAGYENGDVVLEATPAYQQIRNILYSIADKQVISQKLPGGMKVQIPSTFMETNRMKAEMVNGKKTYTSEVLEFYKDEDGKRVCEIMIGRWGALAESSMSDEELINYLNNTDEGKRILSGMGFRIPTQRENSIEVFKIKKFLPREFGDSVIVPAALVNKAGSDFDIDKLTVYLKNLFINKKGEPKLIEFLTDENSTVEERYYQWVVDNADRETKRYVKTLAKDEVSRIRGEFKNELKGINSQYAISLSEKKQLAYNGLVDLYEKDLPLKTTEQDDYIDELFNVGRSVFFSMDENTRSPFWELRESLRNRGVEGPAEIKAYLSLATAMLQDDMYAMDAVHLDNLTKIYSEELRVLGEKEEFVKAYVQAAKENFRKYKNSLVSALNAETSDAVKEAKEKYGEEKQAFNLDYAQEVAKLDGLVSLDEFKNFDIYKQNTKKALENAYIESAEKLVSNKRNFKRLIQPNSADDLKKLSNYIVEKLKLEKFDYSNTGNMLDRNFMSNLRHAFVTGKYAIGIAAVNQTNHSLNQRSPIFIDESRLDLASEADQKFLGDAKIKFFTEKGAANFNTIQIGDKTYVSLSGVTNKDGKDISDINGQFIDGYVDISKGPWIMQLGASPNVASTFLFLNKIGVPIDTVVYFMNQPIIREYLKSLENQGYTFIFNTKAIREIREDDRFDVVASDVSKIDRVPSNKVLQSMLGVTNLDRAQRAQQQYILSEFLKYAKMAEHLFHVTQGTNFDTANFNDPYLVFKKEMKLLKAQDTILAGIDKQGEKISAAESILENSFLKTLRTNVIKTRDALAEILTSDKDNIRQLVQRVLMPYVDMNDRDFVAVAQKVVNDLLDWSVQTNDTKAPTARLNNRIGKALLDDGNYVRQVSEFIDGVRKNRSHPLYNNYIIKALEPVLSDKVKGVDNLKIKNRDNKVYDQNQIIYGFKELKDNLGDMPGNLYQKIATVAVLQSGLSRSPISFTSLLPYEDFREFYNEALYKLNDRKDLRNFQLINVFERNNWNNDDLVPYVKANIMEDDFGQKINTHTAFLPSELKKAVRENELPMVISLPVYSRDAQSDVVVYTWEDNSISAAQKAKMRKQGDYSYIKKGLFKKVKDKVGDPFVYVTQSASGREYVNFVFQAINAWGDSFRANEFYPVARQSKIDNGFIKVDEVAPEAIMAFFTKESPNKKPNKTKIKPKGKPEIDNKNQNSCR